MYSARENMRNNPIIERSARIKRRKKHIRFNIFVMLLVAFVAVAAMQAFELGMMLSEAKSISDDVGGLRSDSVVLLKQYGSYSGSLPSSSKI